VLGGASVLAMLSCTSSVAPPPPDAGMEAGFGVSNRDAGTDALTDGRIDRLVYHGGPTLKRMRVRFVYIGQESVDAAPNVDDFARWLLGSSWWGLLREYGIEEASLDPSVSFPFATVFPSGTIVDGLVASTVFAQRVRALLHPDASTSFSPSDAYVFMLPNGVNVSLGVQGSRTFQTCIDSGGYHAHDGLEAFAVIAPCRLGRSALTISHELAEVATNPVVVDGWFSDNEADRKTGVEVADVCNVPVARGVDGWLVTQLWSNVEGRCIPQ
jgi:hypothetical protein